MSFDSTLINLLGNRRRILITGGAGFIGGHLVKRLIKNSDSIVFNIDKLSYASDNFSINKELEKIGNNAHRRYKLLKTDLSNKLQLKDAFSFADPDIIFHLAAESHVDRSIDNPEQFIDSNIIGTYNLLELSRDHFEKLESIRKEYFRFHHISTDEVFGSLEEKGFFSEESSYNPRSPYSASKAASDHLVKAWNHTYQLPIILTNCSNNFGPWQFPEKLIPIIILKALSGEKIPIYGDGSNIRDWLFVEDHINGLILAATKGIIGESYCIGGSNEKSNIEIAKEICLLLDQKLNKRKSHKDLIEMVKDRPGHDQRYAIDSSKIRNKLDWEPKYQFKEALDITINWYLNNISWVNRIKKRNGHTGKRLGLQLN